jgi:hypothetical protein
VFEYADGLRDVLNPGFHVVDIVLVQMLCDALDVIGNAVREFDAGHVSA